MNGATHQRERERQEREQREVEERQRVYHLITSPDFQARVIAMRDASERMVEAGRYRDAQDTLLVAADAAEELGHATWPGFLRMEAARLGVAAWGREKLALEIRREDVCRLYNRKGEHTGQFGIYHPSSRSQRRFRVQPNWRVVVDRRGRIRALSASSREGGEER